MTRSRILVLDKDEALVEQTRAAATDGDEVVGCTRIGSVAHLREHEGPFDVIVAGPSLGTRSGLRRLASLHREMPGTPIVVAFNQMPDVSLREIVQVGAVDVVELPAEDAVLRAALRRALDMSKRMPGLAVGTATQVAAETTEQPRHDARVFTVCSATGGCGKTFYASNMALFLAQRSGAKVALVDLDLQFGEVTTALRLQPHDTIVDALRVEDERELGVRLEESMVKFEDQFWVLPAPKDPAQADEVTAADITRLLQAIRTRFDYVVVDTPTALAETVLAAFDVSEHLFVMATLDLPSVRNLGMFLQTLQKLRIDSANISLLMNKVESDLGIEMGQITKLFPQGFHATLPYAKEVSKSINLGKPVLESFAASEISRLIRASLVDFLPESARQAVETQERERPAGSIIGRLFRRRAALVGGGA